VTSSHFAGVFTTAGCRFIFVAPAQVHSPANKYGVSVTNEQIWSLWQQMESGICIHIVFQHVLWPTSIFLVLLWARDMSATDSFQLAFGYWAPTPRCPNWIPWGLSRNPLNEVFTTATQIATLHPVTEKNHIQHMQNGPDLRPLEDDINEVPQNHSNWAPCNLSRPLTSLEFSPQQAAVSYSWHLLGFINQRIDMESLTTDGEWDLHL